MDRQTLFYKTLLAEAGVPKKEFNSKSVYNETYLRTKIKSYNGKINTNFHNDKIPKEDSKCIVYQ